LLTLFLVDVGVNFPLFSLVFRVCMQVHARNQTLEKLQFPRQASVSPVFKFTPGNVDEVKQAISTLGSITQVVGDLEVTPTAGSSKNGG